MQPLVAPDEKGKNPMRPEDTSSEEPSSSPSPDGSYEDWSPQMLRHSPTSPRRNDGTGPSSALAPELSQEVDHPAPNQEAEVFAPAIGLMR